MKGQNLLWQLVTLFLENEMFTWDLLCEVDGVIVLMNSKVRGRGSIFCRAIERWYNCACYFLLCVEVFDDVQFGDMRSCRQVRRYCDVVHILTEVKSNGTWKYIQILDNRMLSHVNVKVAKNKLCEENSFFHSVHWVSFQNLWRKCV